MPTARNSYSNPDPILSRMKLQRKKLGLSLKQLAKAAGLRSAAYVFHVENGQKVPREDVAHRIARALGEDEALFGAWARALQRSDLRTVLDASSALLRDAEMAAFAAGAWSPLSSVASAPNHAYARLRIPVIPEATDPGDSLRPTCEVIRTLSLDAEALGSPQAFVRPFAYVLSERSVARMPGLGAGRIAIVSRAFEPLDPRRVHAVRTPTGIQLGRVMWNGSALVLLSDTDGGDFEVLVASGVEGLRACVLGAVVRTFDAARIG